MRKLQITLAGRWYLALTVALGVVAMVSGNNVLYLIESLLLASLVLSGILSERAISSLEVEWIRGHATAGATFPDRFRIRNPRRFAIYCIEIGEWRDGRMIPHVYLPRIAPKSVINQPSRALAEKRGTHRWEAFAIATSFPYGFARKVLLIREPGERLIWPEAPRRAASSELILATRPSLAGGGEISDGEVRPYDYQDDSRMIVWTQSAKGQGPMVRVRRRDQGNTQVTLNLKMDPGPEFESSVSRAAAPFHESDDSIETTLTIIGHSGARKLRGKRRSLDALAITEAEGTS